MVIRFLKGEYHFLQIGNFVAELEQRLETSFEKELSIHYVSILEISAFDVQSVAKLCSKCVILQTIYFIQNTEIDRF